MAMITETHFEKKRYNNDNNENNDRITHIKLTL